MRTQCTRSKHILLFANGDNFVRLTKASVPYSGAGGKEGAVWTANARMPGGMDQESERRIPGATGVTGKIQTIGFAWGAAVGLYLCKTFIFVLPEPSLKSR
jgi:hypothetical protein